MGRHRTRLVAPQASPRQRRNRRRAARWAISSGLSEFSRDAENESWSLAYTHARLGHHDEALHFLEVAYERREFGLLQARLDPDLDLLRGDPRFTDLLRRVGPPE